MAVYCRLFLALFSCLCLDTSFCQSNQSKTKEDFIKVAHINKTGVFIRKGDQLKIGATDYIYLSKELCIGPNGADHPYFDNSRIHINYPYAKLMAKIGSTLYDIGAERQIESFEDGELVLFNNMVSNDDGGAFKVKVELNGKKLKFENKKVLNPVLIGELKGISHMEKIWFSPDGGVTAAWDGKRNIAIWDSESAKRLEKIIIPEDDFLEFKFKTYLPQLVALTEDGRIYLWDFSKGTENMEPKIFKTVGEVDCWSFDSEGSYLVISNQINRTISTECKLRAYDLGSLFALRGDNDFIELETNFRNIGAIVFYENDPMLVVTGTKMGNPYLSEGTQIQIWNTDKWQLERSAYISDKQSTINIINFLDPNIVSIQLEFVERVSYTGGNNYYTMFKYWDLSTFKEIRDKKKIKALLDMQKRLLPKPLPVDKVYGHNVKYEQIILRDRNGRFLLLKYDINKLLDLSEY